MPVCSGILSPTGHSRVKKSQELWATHAGLRSQSVPGKGREGTAGELTLSCLQLVENRSKVLTGMSVSLKTSDLASLTLDLPCTFRPWAGCVHVWQGAGSQKARQSPLKPGWSKNELRGRVLNMLRSSSKFACRAGEGCLCLLSLEGWRPPHENWTRSRNALNSGIFP